ncbi:MAG: beta-propeller domain-containing protein, partial [Oscillospiraceae bacterium]|nr:beta-propeller domain-containing protein [Oscillospiraceae bacterium]
GESDFSETNNQVAGIQEADIIKTDGKNIYFMSSYTQGVNVVSADDGNMEQIASITREDAYPIEMLLYGKQLIIIWSKEKYENQYDFARSVTPLYTYWKSETVVDVYDTDGDFRYPASTYTQDGHYNSSRMIDNTIYLITSYWPQIYAPFEMDEYEVYIPSYSVNDDSFFIRPSFIVLPEKLENIEYTVIAGLDVHRDDMLISVQANLGGSHNIYASFDNIYVTRTTYEYEEAVYDAVADDASVMIARPMSPGNYTAYTIINKFSIDLGYVDYVATGKVAGTLNNQFHLDEHNGILRVVTAVWGDEPQQGNSGSFQVLPLPETAGWWDNQWEWQNGSWQVDTNGDWSFVVDQNAVNPRDYSGWGLQGGSLYTLDENMNVLAEVHRIGFGEHVQSVRFIGDIAYIVTFWQTDPLFSFDLSDPRNPVLLDELKIPGFSRYLHPWADGLLLGMGVDTDDDGVRTGLKVTMFGVDNANELVEKHTYVIEGSNNRNTFNSDENFWHYTWINSPMEHDHKSVLISPQKNIIAFPYSKESSFNSWTPGTNDYFWSSDSTYAYAILSYDPDYGFSLTGELKDEFYMDSDSINDDYYYNDYWAGQYQRGLYIGDVIYAAALNKIVSLKITDSGIEVIQTLELEREYAPIVYYDVEPTEEPPMEGEVIIIMDGMELEVYEEGSDESEPPQLYEEPVAPMARVG